MRAKISIVEILTLFLKILFIFKNIFIKWFIFIYSFIFFK